MKFCTCVMQGVGIPPAAAAPLDGRHRLRGARQWVRAQRHGHRARMTLRGPMWLTIRSYDSYPNAYQLLGWLQGWIQCPPVCFAILGYRLRNEENAAQRISMPLHLAVPGTRRS